MIQLTTNYMGLELKNPLIVSSSGLTNQVDKIRKIEEKGAGAVVLKSLFEEQISHDAAKITAQGVDYPEAFDYINAYTRSHSVNEYFKLIEDARAAVNIPVMASINCLNATEWTDFAKSIEDAGAQAIELNMHILSSEKNSTPEYLEQFYLEIVHNVSSKVKIPVAAKIGSQFTNIVRMADRLYGAGARGLVLFNRFYEPDIDIEDLSLTSAEILSSPADIRQSLRWVGIVSERVPQVHISASTGNHDGQAIIKQILAGARTAQICSVLYRQGLDVIPEILKEIEDWMERKNFSTLEEFRGILNIRNIPNPDLFERVQFMKYFSNFE
jgi:dihydroorotate dehydrogenase (fumarate)